MPVSHEEDEDEEEEGVEGKIANTTSFESETPLIIISLMISKILT